MSSSRARTNSGGDFERARRPQYLLMKSEIVAENSFLDYKEQAGVADSPAE